MRLRPKSPEKTQDSASLPSDRATDSFLSPPMAVRWAVSESGGWGTRTTISLPSKRSFVAHVGRVATIVSPCVDSSIAFGSLPKGIWSELPLAESVSACSTWHALAEIGPPCERARRTTRLERTVSEEMTTTSSFPGRLQATIPLVSPHQGRTYQELEFNSLAYQAICQAFSSCPPHLPTGAFPPSSSLPPPHLLLPPPSAWFTSPRIEKEASRR